MLLACHSVEAVLVGANTYQRFMPMLMTAAGTVKAARVLIMGVGVAGLQAIATAKRLGAVIEASDVRPPVKEQVESLGAKFIDVPFLTDEEKEIAQGSGGAYAFSGGLHGVGVSVTNALSKRLEISVWRKDDKGNGYHHLVFEHGEVVEPLTSMAAPKDGKKSGTRVTAWPDAKYFDSSLISQVELQRLLRSKAVLLPGVTVTLNNAKTGDSQTWKYDEGLRGYLTEALAQASDGETLIPLFEGAQFAGPDAEGFAEGEGAAWVVAWTESGAVVRESYVNLIPTPNGGTHESGLRDGLFGAVKNFAEMHSLLPKGVKLLPEDVFARVSFRRDAFAAAERRQAAAGRRVRA
eukprot:gene32164-36310_t